MKARAVLRLRFPSEKILGIVYKALAPEIAKPPTTRSTAQLERDGKILVLRVEAKDTAALRAALNAYLRWISSTTDVLEVLERQPQF
jgi:tRNA threonylcarbamoyladenosine modification (KEOPS) complex  Pcc1 subunit